MPRVTFTYDLPDEQYELLAALRGVEYLSVLHDIDYTARNQLKHGPGSTEALCRALEDIRSIIREAPRAEKG